MKLTITIISLTIAVAVGIVALPILGRVQANKAEEARRSRLASRLKNIKPRTNDTDSARWQAAAKAFDKNKATAAAIFKGADKVEALRLFQVGSEKPLGQVADHVPFFAKHTVSDATFASRLSAVVLDAKSFALLSPTQCYIEPAVAFRVWKGQQFTDTVICFKCDQLAVLERNETAPKRSIGGLLTGHFNIGGNFVARPQLLALTKAAFPDDSAVQAIR